MVLSKICYYTLMHADEYSTPETAFIAAKNSQLGYFHWQSSLTSDALKIYS